MRILRPLIERNPRTKSWNIPEFRLQGDPEEPAKEGQPER